VDLRLIVTDSYGSQSRANALAKFLRLAGKLAEARQKGEQRSFRFGPRLKNVDWIS
jgi:hypothetical protein